MPWFRRPWALEAASAILIAVIVIVYALFSVIHAPGTGDSSTPLADAIRPITVIAPTTDVPFAQTFVWQAAEGATSYQVVVFTATKDRVFELRDLKSASIAIDDTVKLPRGHYFWKVTAFRGVDEVSQSALTEFLVQ